jgi:hypothetical protein
MNKDIELEKYTDEEIKEMIIKYKTQRQLHNIHMKEYYHKQRKKAEEGDENAQQFIQKRREKAQESYKRLNSKETITEERRLRNQAIDLFKYWKKKGDIPKFMENHPEKVEILKKYNTYRKRAKDKYPELFLEESNKND